MELTFLVFSSAVPCPSSFVLVSGQDYMRSPSFGTSLSEQTVFSLGAATYPGSLMPSPRTPPGQKKIKN